MLLGHQNHVFMKKLFSINASSKVALINVVPRNFLRIFDYKFFENELILIFRFLVTYLPKEKSKNQNQLILKKFVVKNA